ncbi:MAG: carbohydrate binding domain-containing protein, partial [Armatimonadetes bacterium]|nr:carbohydrate binding domain-containing protein [Armatimonadota bacterium]
MRLALSAAGCLAALGCAPAQNGAILANGDFRQGTAGWSIPAGPDLAASVVPADAGGFKQALHLECHTKPGANPWALQVTHRFATAVKQGDRLRLSYWLRSPQACKVGVTCQINRAPWTNFASRTLTLAPAWTQYGMSATFPADFAAGELMVDFHVGQAEGVVEIAGVSAMPVLDNPLGLLPFVLPWDDASPGITNVAGLLPAPAGRDGFVVVRDGHLYTGDHRLRLLGTNITSGGAFPGHDVAEKVAGRLARFGINAVRFHHMDSSWANPSMYQADKRRLNPAALDNLDYFIARLKAHGVYTDLNLHVSRVYPGQPTWTGMHDFFKGVDSFYPPMLELQREYARDLLTHLNPYTGTRYVDEPCVAFVEINNENGLLSSWWGGGLDGMPEVYAGELQRQWNAWLEARYPAAAALTTAWTGTSRPLGEELLTDGAKWFLEQNGGAKGTLELAARGELRAAVTAVDGEGWHVQLLYPGLQVSGKGTYTLAFEARSSEPRTISLDCRMAHDPWRTLWEGNARLGTEWKSFRLVVSPAADEDNARITFGTLGAQVGAVELRGVSLRPGGGYELRPGDQRGNVAWVKFADYANLPPGMRADWVRFLWETEERYWTGMRSYVRDELGAHALVFGSACGFSPILVQAQLDVVDGHSYWQHPHFPHRPWDAEDWTVPNVAMAGVPGGGTLAGLAGMRVAGKPYVVTEYNHPAPNTHNSEAFLLLAAYAALQDWDGFFSFDYHGAQTGWDAGRIPGFFSVDQHPAQMATMPTAAALFLRGDVSPPEQWSSVPAGRERAIELVARSGPWVNSGQYGLPPSLVLRRPIGLTLGDQPAAKVADPGGDVIPSDNGQLTWDLRDRQGVVTINTPRTKGAIGATTKGPYRLGEVTIAPGDNLQQWAAITLTEMSPGPP